MKVLREISWPQYAALYLTLGLVILGSWQMDRVTSSDPSSREGAAAPVRYDVGPFAWDKERFSTRWPAPVDLMVPDVRLAGLALNVAIPRRVVSGGPGYADRALRTFAIRAEQGRFFPDTIIAREKDTVRIELSAADDVYDFTQPDHGFAEVVLPGERRTIQFDVSAPGRFMFYCASCGGPESGAYGYLLVAFR